MMKSKFITARGHFKLEQQNQKTISSRFKTNLLYGRQVVNKQLYRKYTDLSINNGVHNLQDSKDYGMILLNQQDFKYLDNFYTRLEQIYNLIIQSTNTSQMFSSSSPIPDKNDQILIQNYQTGNHTNMEDHNNKEVCNSNAIQNTKQNLDISADINNQQLQYQQNQRKITINQPEQKSNYNFKQGNQSQFLQNLQNSTITGEGYTGSLNKIPPFQNIQTAYSNQPNQKDNYPWMNNIQQTITNYFQQSKIEQFYNQNKTNIQGSGQVQQQYDFYGQNSSNQFFTHNSQLLKARLLVFLLMNDIKEYQLSCRELCLSDYKKYRVKWIQYEQKHREEYEKSMMNKIQSDRNANQKYQQYLQKIQQNQQQSYNALHDTGDLCLLAQQNVTDSTFIDSVIGNDIQAYSINKKKSGVYSSIVSRIEDQYQQRTVIVNMRTLLKNFSKILTVGEKTSILLDQHNHIDSQLLTTEEKNKLREAYGENIIEENYESINLLAPNVKTQATGVFFNQIPYVASMVAPQPDQSRQEKTNNNAILEEDVETYRDMILSVIQSIYNLYKDDSNSVSIQTHRFYTKQGSINPLLYHRKRYLNEILKANIQILQKQNMKPNQSSNNTQNTYTNQTQPNPYLFQTNKSNINNNNNQPGQRTFSFLPQVRPSILISNYNNYKNEGQLNTNISNANVHNSKNSPTKTQKNQQISYEMAEKVFQQQFQETQRNIQLNHQNFQGQTQHSEDTNENNQSFNQNNQSFHQNNQSNNLNSVQACNQNNQSCNQINQSNIQQNQSFNTQNAQSYNQMTIPNNNNSQQINHQNVFNANTINITKKNLNLNMTEQVSQTMSNHSYYQNLTGQNQEKNYGNIQQQLPENHISQQNTIKNNNQYEKTLSDINQQSLIQSGVLQQQDFKNNLNPLLFQNYEQNSHLNKQSDDLENFIINTQNIEEFMEFGKYRKLRVVRVSIEIQQNLTSEHQTSNIEKSTNCLSQMQEYIQYLSPLPLTYKRLPQDQYVTHCYIFYVENFIYLNNLPQNYRNDNYYTEYVGLNNGIQIQNGMIQKDVYQNNHLESDDSESMSIDNTQKGNQIQKKITHTNLDIIAEQNAQDEFNNGSDISRKSKKLNYKSNQIKQNNPKLLKRQSTSRVSQNSRAHLNLEFQSNQNSFALKSQQRSSENLENILEYKNKKIDQQILQQQQEPNKIQGFIRPQQISFNGKLDGTQTTFYNEQQIQDTTTFDLINQETTERKDLSNANLNNYSVNHDKSNNGLLTDRNNIDDQTFFQRRASNNNFKTKKRDDSAPRPNKSKTIDVMNFQQHPSGEIDTFPSSNMLNSQVNDDFVRQKEKIGKREKEQQTELKINSVRESDTQMQNQIIQKNSSQRQPVLQSQKSMNMQSNQQVQDNISEISDEDYGKGLEYERNERDLTTIVERSEINNSLWKSIANKNLQSKFQQSSKIQDLFSNQQSGFNYRSSNLQSQFLTDDIFKQNYSKIQVQSQQIVQNSQPIRDQIQESQLVGKSFLQQNIQNSNYQNLNSFLVGNNQSQITNHLLQNFELKFNKDEQENKDIFVSQKMN